MINFASDDLPGEPKDLPGTAGFISNDLMAAVRNVTAVQLFFFY
jgi:hypothetical protein